MILFLTESGVLPSKSLSTLSEKSATVAEFRRCLAVFGDSRTFLRQSHFSGTVWTGLYEWKRRVCACHFLVCSIFVLVWFYLFWFHAYEAVTVKINSFSTNDPSTSRPMFAVVDRMTWTSVMFLTFLQWTDATLCFGNRVETVTFMASIDERDILGLTDWMPEIQASDRNVAF